MVYVSTMLLMVYQMSHKNLWCQAGLFSTLFISQMLVCIGIIHTCLSLKNRKVALWKLYCCSRWETWMGLCSWSRGAFNSSWCSVVHRWSVGIFDHKKNDQYALMGRYGNKQMINWDEDYTLHAKKWKQFVSISPMLPTHVHTIVIDGVKWKESEG